MHICIYIEREFLNIYIYILNIYIYIYIYIYGSPQDPQEGVGIVKLVGREGGFVGNLFFFGYLHSSSKARAL
jgi:hypothetical protein